MKLFRVVLRSVNNGVHYRQCNRSMSTFPGFTDPLPGPDNNSNSAESPDDFEKRIFGDSQDQTNSLFRSFDKVQNAHYGPGFRFTHGEDASGGFGGDNNSLTTLPDGMEGKLKQAATYFEVDPQEIAADDYTYRSDMNLKPKMTYTPEDLNIRKPGVWKPNKWAEFEVTTKEVLENADFRNVRFLANFLTEAGLLIKRSKTGISAKAQRKIAREIKTARAFGLLPFTTMGTKAFEVGKTMQNLDQDFEVDPYENPSFVEDGPDSIAE
ncbi:uncharacterized protein LOC141615481 isoform X1 [Silene latifolia]|uniref:uncharacterized protein LOC141615481 isoform X1 n=1 Tax=Silene latifolia TaxID=37657 RepID=UPI003D76F0FA